MIIILILNKNFLLWYIYEAFLNVPINPRYYEILLFTV